MVTKVLSMPIAFYWMLHLGIAWVIRGFKETAT